MGELKSGLNLVFRELPEGHIVYWMGFQVGWSKWPWRTNLMVKESWNAYPSCSISQEYGVTREGRYREGWSITPRQVNHEESSSESMTLPLSSFPYSIWTFTNCNQLSQPFRERRYDHQTFLLPVLCLCHRSLPRSWHKSQPGKCMLQDGFQKRRASQLLDAAGPLQADVARREALAWQLVLWGTLQAVYIKSRPAWKAFKQKWNIPLWQDAQRKISTCQLDPLLSPLLWSLFSSAFG